MWTRKVRESGDRTRAQPAIESPSPCRRSSSGAPTGPRLAYRSPWRDPTRAPRSARMRRNESARPCKGTLDVLGPQRAAPVRRATSDGLLDGLVDVVRECVDELVGDALLLGSDCFAHLALHDEETAFLLLSFRRLGHPAPPCS